MAKIDLATVTAPLSDEQACGPDLDMAFDMDFMNFVTEIDGRIPTAFFSFEPGSLDFAAYYERIGEILQRTRDLRVLVPLAKLRILQSDLSGFAETLDAIQRLLKERWSDLHPQPAEFLELGMGQLATLDDMPNVILPLQHAPLVRSRRAGAITLRRWQVARGEINPREGEETLDGATITGALADADAKELGRSRDALVRARDAVAGILAVCIQEAGYDKAPILERLPAALDAAIALIRTATGGPAAPEAEPAAEATAAGQGAGTMLVRLPAGGVATREQAIEAMHAAARYFALREPSSPVPILLREAQTAASKSFYELVNDLVPDSAGSAFVALGREPWFEVYLSTLEARNPAPDYQDEVDEAVMAEDAGVGDDEAEAPSQPDGDQADDADAIVGTEISTPPGSASAAGDAQPREPAEVTDEASPPQSGEPVERGAASKAVAAPAVETRSVTSAAPRLVATTRPESVALLQKVLEYYRVAEPSSPVPLLVERAIDMSSRNFIELLGSVLPEGSLKMKPQDS
jgi:type VI secretion system protein ImpA